MNILKDILTLSKIKKLCMLIIFILLFYYFSPTNYKTIIINPEISKENKIRIGYSNNVIAILPYGWQSDSSKMDVVAFLDESALHIVPTDKKPYVEVFTRGWFIRFSKAPRIQSNHIKKVIVYYNNKNNSNHIEYYPIT